MDFPVTGCITSAQKFSNGIVVLCMVISIKFFASLVKNVGIGLMGGVLSDGVGFCVLLLLMVLSRFDRLGSGMDCVMVRSPSEVGMVTPSEGCFNCMLFEGAGSTGVIPDMFALVTRWCVRGAKRICVGDVGVDDVWVVFFSFDVTLSAVVPNIFSNLWKASPWRPWKVRFSCMILCIARVSDVYILFVVSIRVSVGIDQCLG